MIRTTAEASNTRLGDFNETTSTLPVLVNQCFQRWLKCGSTRLLRQSSQLCQRLSTPLTLIATTGLLQINQGLLAQTAAMSGWIPDGTVPWVSIGRVGGVGGVGTPSTQLSWSGLPDLSQMKRQPREV